MISRTNLWLAAVLALAIGLQLAAAAQKSFWEDEAWTVQIIQADNSEVIQATSSDYHPPLYFLALASWGRFVGYSELAIRSFSIIFVALTLFLAFKMTSTIFSIRTAFIALILLAFSPFVLMYGHNARYYSMSAALSLVIALATYHYQRSTRLLFLVIYILASVALLYTMYIGFTVILACCLWWLISLRKQENLRSHVFFWLLAQGVVILLYWPWMSVLLSTTNSSSVNPSLTILNWLTAIATRVGYLGFAFSVGETISPTNPLAWLAIVTVIGVSIFLLVKRASSPFFWVPLMFFAVGEAINIVISLITRYPISAPQALPYRTFYLFPFFIMWLAAGISTMKTKSALTALGLLLIIYSTGIFNYFTNQQFIKPHLAVPWNTILGTIQADAQEDAVIICNQADSVCPFYVRRYGFEAYSPGSWTTLKEEEPSEVWWIHSNLGRALYDKEQELATLNEISGHYHSTNESYYAHHDPSIRRLKTTLLHQDDYEYRVILIQLTEPIKNDKILLK